MRIRNLLILLFLTTNANSKEGIDTSLVEYKNLSNALLAEELDSVKIYFEPFYYKFHNESNFDSTLLALIRKGKDSTYNTAFIGGFLLHSTFNFTDIVDLPLSIFLLNHARSTYQRIMNSSDVSSDRYFMAFGDISLTYYYMGVNFFVSGLREESSEYFSLMKKFDGWEFLIPAYEDELFRDKVLDFIKSL